MARAKRIMIVDDERLVIDGFSLTVKRELAPDFEVCGSASSGKEAVAAIASSSPDIVLMDVSMPGLSGLEAIREARRRGCSASFILVTAYERFDIVREALELGVSDYLLKPVSKDNLVRSLRTASLNLDAKAEAERREMESREHREVARAFASQAFIRSAMLLESPGPGLDELLAAMDLPEPSALAVAAAFIPLPGAAEPEAEEEALYDSYSSALRYKTRALVGPLARGRCLALLFAHDEAEAASALSALRAAASTACAEAIANGSLLLGEGRLHPVVEAQESWREALADLSRAGTEEVSGGEDRIEGRPEASLFQTENEIIDALSEGSPSKARLAFDRLLISAGAQNPVEARARIASLIGSAARILLGKGLVDREAAQSLLAMGSLLDARGERAISSAAAELFDRLCGSVDVSPHWSLPVARAMSFIKENYHKQITLEHAAERAGVSPNRLSRILVEETGKGFSDHLIERRIEEAKILLALPNASVKEVSISCGYPDPNYFSRLFKKVTGSTPTTWTASRAEA